MIAFSGVLSSWLMLARNSLLARFADSATSFAVRSSPSTRLRAVMSRAKATQYSSPPNSR